MCNKSKIFHTKYDGNLLLYITAHVSTDASMVILTSSDHYFKSVPIMTAAKNHHYGFVIASPYVGMTQKQDGGSNQACDNFITRKQTLVSKST